MKVMVYLGKATPKVVNNLKSMSDDVDFAVYTSVTNFVQEAETRHLSFNRVVFNNKFVPRGEQDYISLNEFIRAFSNATELVMVINNGDTESEAMFNKYFSSPMHTCVIVKGATSMDFFRDIVSAPIAEVKARYYTLDKGESASVTARSVDTKIGSLRGGAKKSPETEESDQGSAVVPEPVSNPVSTPKKFSDDDIMGNGLEIQSSPVDSGSAVTGGNNDFEEVSGFEVEAPTPVEHTSSTGEDFVADDEDDLLSVGSFGSAHSDTDMFDEDDEPEEIIDEPTENPVDVEAQQRRKELEEQNRIAEEIQRQQKATAGKGREHTVTPPTEKPVVKKSWNNLRGTPYAAYKLNFVIGVNGSGSAQQIVDDAVRMMEAGMKVLIVDMDFVNNGILSFINTKNFYSGNHNGYTSGRVFVEERIGVLSGGYGFIPSGEELHMAIGKGVEKYDIVLVDCPVSSIQYITPLILECNNIIVFSGNDPSQIVATALALTDRNNCSLEHERVIMSKGKPILVGDSEDLVQETVSSMLFANGCWLT